MEVCFLPYKVILFCRKKWSSSDPYELGWRPLWPMKNYKSQSFLGGFWSSKLHESFEIWLIIPRHIISKKIILYCYGSCWEGCLHNIESAVSAPPSAGRQTRGSVFSRPRPLWVVIRRCGADQGPYRLFFCGYYCKYYGPDYFDQRRRGSQSWKGWVQKLVAIIPSFCDADMKSG